MRYVGRALLATEQSGADIIGKHHLVTLAHHVVDRERYGGVVELEQRVNAVVHPLAGDRDADVGVVLVVGYQQLDLQPLQPLLRGDFLDRLPRACDRPSAAEMAVRTEAIL